MLVALINAGGDEVAYQELLSCLVRSEYPYSILMLEREMWQYSSKRDSTLVDLLWVEDHCLWMNPKALLYLASESRARPAEDRFP